MYKLCGDRRIPPTHQSKQKSQLYTQHLTQSHLLTEPASLSLLAYTTSLPTTAYTLQDNDTTETFASHKACSQGAKATVGNSRALGLYLLYSWLDGMAENSHRSVRSCHAVVQRLVMLRGRRPLDFERLLRWPGDGGCLRQGS